MAVGINPNAKKPLLYALIAAVVVGLGIWKTFVYDKREIDVSGEIKMVGSVAIPDAPEASTNKEVVKLDFPGDKPSVNGGTRFTLKVMAWQSQNGWAYAAGGPRTTKGSLFDKYNLDVDLVRQDDCAQSCADFVKFVKDYKENPNTPGVGVSFMWTGAIGYLKGLTESLKELGPDYAPIIIMSTGKSNGEDQVIGDPSIKNNPQLLKGQVCIGVRLDGDQDVAIKYANDNNVKVNPNPKYYDYDALNLMYPEKADFIMSSNKYNAGTQEKRRVVQNGKTTTRDTMVSATMVATWTPGDDVAFKGKGGVSIISTKEYSSMMSNAIIVCKKWANDHRTDVENMIMALAQAGDQIRNFDDAKRYACGLNVKIYGEKDPKFWYDTYNSIPWNGTSHIGGSMVYNLADMANFYGLGETRQDIAKAVYQSFADMQSKYYPEDIAGYVDYSKAVDKSFLMGVISNHPELMEGKALTVDYTTKTVTAENRVASKSEQIQFDFGKATISPSSYALLDKLANDLISSEGLKILLVGHTDNVGSEEQNQILSQARAESVKQYFLKKGIPSTRIDTEGKGSQEPIESNSTQAGRDKNRRVEIILG